MNNNTFKNAFGTNFGANFNIATTNNANKIINAHYNIYPKNFGQFENKFRKNNEKRQTILKNSSAVNVLLTFFHYNNTNNNWFYAENMFSFTDIKEGFWETFRKIFEGINLNSETILKNNSSVNVLLTFFPYNNTNNNWFYGGNMFNFCYIKEKFLEIFEGINKLINNTPDMFIRKINYITEKFTNNNSEKILGNNLIKLLTILLKFIKIFLKNYLQRQFLKTFEVKQFLI